MPPEEAQRHFILVSIACCTSRIGESGPTSQSPGGAPTVDRQQAADYFIAELQKRLSEKPADLVVLPEAAFPPLNDDARHRDEPAVELLRGLGTGSVAKVIGWGVRPR